MEGLSKLINGLIERIAMLEKQMKNMINRYVDMEHAVEKNRLDVKRLEDETGSKPKTL